MIPQHSRRSAKKFVILFVLQVGVFAMFIGSAGLLLAQVPKVYNTYRYYTSVSMNQTDHKLDESSDTASRLEEELIQSLNKGSISAEDFASKLSQLKQADAIRTRAFEAYKPAK